MFSNPGYEGWQAEVIELLMEDEPGLMWLAGLGEVNHYILSDFRSGNEAALKELLVELLGVLSKEGFVKLYQVDHDGTKIRAQAGADTFRREATLEKELAKARQVVEDLERERQPDGEQGEFTRREQARKLAAMERLECMEQAAAELEKIRQNKGTEKEKAEARVSLTEPEARVMKHGDQAFAPSYNVQLSTDAESKIIVGVDLTRSRSNNDSLLPAVEQVRENMGEYPRQAVADGAFATKAASMKAIRRSARRRSCGTRRTRRWSVRAVRRWLRCGKVPNARISTISIQRRPALARALRTGTNVVPGPLRLVSNWISKKGSVAALRGKMKTDEGSRNCKRRGPVAEFPDLWNKEKLWIQKFRLRGVKKVATEALFGVLSNDVRQWMRLSWMPKFAARAEGAVA